MAQGSDDTNSASCVHGLYCMHSGLLAPVVVKRTAPRSGVRGLELLAEHIHVLLIEYRAYQYSS